MFNHRTMYKCNYCSNTWTNGFFRKRRCPFCNRAKRLRRYILVLLVSGVLFSIASGLQAGVFKIRFPNALMITARPLVDSSSFYTHGIFPYISQLPFVFYEFNQHAEPYRLLKIDQALFNAPVSKPDGSFGPIKATLQAGQAVKIISVLVDDSMMEWYELEYYDRDKRKRGFIPIINDATDADAHTEIMTVIEWADVEAKAIETYTSFLRENFIYRFIEETGEDAVRQAALEGAFIIEDLYSSAGTFIISWTQRSRLETARNWHLNPRFIEMQLTQSDADYKRPSLELPDPLSYNYFKLKKTLPFTEHIPEDEVLDKAAKKLARGRKVRLVSVQMMENYSWGRVSFYEGDQAVSGLIRLPKKWEPVLSPYNPDKEKQAALRAFYGYLKENMEISEFTEGLDAAKDAAASGNLIIIPELTDENRVYAAPLEEELHIDKAWEWYLAVEHIDLAVTQMMRNFKRPDLKLVEEL